MDHFLRHGTTGLINPSPGVFVFVLFFVFNARPDEEGQATFPLESLSDLPQLSVSRKFTCGYPLGLQPTVDYNLQFCVFA